MIICNVNRLLGCTITNPQNYQPALQLYGDFYSNSKVSTVSTVVGEASRTSGSYRARCCSQEPDSKYMLDASIHNCLLTRYNNFVGK